MEACWARDGGDAEGAQDSLAFYLRVFGPWQLGLGPEFGQCTRWRIGSMIVGARVGGGGQGLGVALVEWLVRIGPDGPEGPRPSDYDPQRRSRSRNYASKSRSPAVRTRRSSSTKNTLILARLVREEDQQRRTRLANQDGLASGDS